MRGQRFAFGDLFADIGVWFAVGVAVAALITMLLPADLGASMAGMGQWPMLGMLAVALPMYVCATASTPIAAALAMKGVPPSALLVFLLAGPATNAATIGMVAKLLGRKAVVIYVGSIIAATLLFGVAVDSLYEALGYDVHAWLIGVGAEEDGWASSFFAALMAVLLLREIVRLVGRFMRRKTSTASE